MKIMALMLFLLFVALLLVALNRPVFWVEQSQRNGVRCWTNRSVSGGKDAIVCGDGLACADGADKCVRVRNGVVSAENRK